MSDARELLDQGRRCQQLGALDRALQCFREAIEAAAREGDVALQAEGWRRVSSVRRARGDWEGALEAAHRSRAILHRTGDSDGLAETLNAEAAVHISRGEFGAARPLLEEATELAGCDRVLGITLQNLGFVAARTGDLDGAERYFHVSAAHFHRAGYRWGEACVLTNHAAAALDRRDFKLADAMAERAIAAAREVEDLNLLALATLNRAEALACIGDLAQAEDLVSEALGYFGSTGDPVRQVAAYRLLGDISLKRGDETTARRCWEVGLEMARRTEARLESTELSARLDDLPAPVRKAPERRERTGDRSEAPPAGP